MLQEINEEWTIDMFGEQGTVFQECTEKVRFDSSQNNVKFFKAKSKQDIHVYQFVKVLQ